MPLTASDLRPADVPEPEGPFGPADHVAKARSMRAELEAASAEIDDKRELTPRIVDLLIEHGLYRMALPRAIGGAELDLATYAQTIEALAMGDASTAWCVGQATGCAMSAAYLPWHAAERIFGDKRAVVAWGPGSAKAVPVEGGYQVTGKWSFASGIRHATWIGGHTPVFEADGTTPRRAPDGEQLVRTFFFPREQVRIIDTWHVIGLKGTGSDTYEVSDVFVPEDFCYGRDNGERRLDSLLYRFPINVHHSTGFAAVALGIARRVLDSFRDVVQVKTPRLQKSTAKLRENNTVQGQVAVAEARLRSARLFLFDTLERAWREAECTGRVTLDQRMLIRLAATFANNEARAVVDLAYYGAGALAVLSSNPFERRFRDMHAVSQQVQARQQHFETVGQYMLGLDADLTLV